MKKLICTIIIVAASSVQMFAGPVVTVRVEFGKQSAECKRFGICDWGVDVSFKSSTTVTSFQFDEKNNTLFINIPQNAVAGKEEYFKGQTIGFEEAVKVPANVQKALGSKTEITIEAGK